MSTVIYAMFLCYYDVNQPPCTYVHTGDPTRSTCLNLTHE
jgi:hypothetical protein